MTLNKGDWPLLTTLNISILKITEAKIKLELMVMMVYATIVGEK